VTTTSPAKNHDIAHLDSLTGGAFSAPTSGERAARVRQWLLSNPASELMTDVFRELSVKDKGAAKLVRERLDEIKRAKGQEMLVHEWATKAQRLLDASKLHIADALAWQRDAAKAGAPLSRDPLSGLKNQLTERVRVVEDLQRRVQVQREAAVLLAQRIEVLSTKSWKDAASVVDALRVDVQQWQTQADSLLEDVNWGSLDIKFSNLLEASRSQLLLVSDAFQAALAAAVAASQNSEAVLPLVPVWADEIRAQRGLPPEGLGKQVKPKVDPLLREQAQAAVLDALKRLEQEVEQGHGKASTGAAAALRHALKEFGKYIDDKLEVQANGALAAAGELEGWQRWRADQLRQELLSQAEGLLKRPDGQALGGRKMQESLRTLRDQWKQTDQGGIPNHALWKRFDEACNEAYKVVEAWLDKVKAESAEHKAQRLALIEEVNAWASANATALDDDWKGFSRVLHQFADRWRDAGHLGEKAFAEISPLWKEAFAKAAAPLEAVQSESLALRQAMIEEAKQLGSAPELRVDAVKSLQQRWQAVAHRIPMDRRQEQKLWDAFRKPIDDAFNRKTMARQQAEAALGARDHIVLEAAKALEAANASGDVQAIRVAMTAMENALRGQAQVQDAVNAAVLVQNKPGSPVVNDVDATECVAVEVAQSPVKVAPKVVLAVRGDDRPGMKRDTPAPPTIKNPKKFERKDIDRTSHRGDAPRLGETAFRAQRDAMEHAQQTLRKLAAQAHGESITQLLNAWEKRDSSLVPNTQELGLRASPGTRAVWVNALALNQVASGKPVDPLIVLLRLEIAADVPTAAEYLVARRTLQLQLLTQRNEPSPAQTWGHDVAALLSTAFDAQIARRLQNVLKVLLKK
jgi:ATP-dependent RNA helicase SUPV3L1/SUV3